MKKTIIAALFFTFCVGAPLPATANTNAEATYRATLIQLIELLQQQVELLTEELAKQQADARTDANTKRFSETVATVARYDLPQSRAVSQIANQSHRTYFERFFALLPDEFDERVGRVETFDQAQFDVDAFVETLPPEHEQWRFAVDAVLVRNPFSRINTELLVHEIAHIISYESVPTIPASPRNCHFYFDFHGCPPTNSYLTQFVNQFWSEGELVQAAGRAEATDPAAAAYRHFTQHQTEFVTDYAALGPEEDFAESFTFFVLGLETAGTLAEEKVQFFSAYPVLLQLRREMQANL